MKTLFLYITNSYLFVSAPPAPPNQSPASLKWQGFFILIPSQTIIQTFRNTPEKQKAYFFASPSFPLAHHA